MNWGLALLEEGQSQEIWLEKLSTLLTPLLLLLQRQAWAALLEG